jgi:uncharacterized membrane protein YdjX (TVP38/TMEM64 family)
MRNRLLLLSVISAIAAVAYFSEFYQYLTPDRMRELANDAGVWGPVLMIVSFSLLEPFFVPGAIFLLAAATLWPFWLALLVNWLGATGAGMIGFAFARYFGRDWVEDRMPARLRMWDERLSAKGLPAVILFRVLFFLNPASHWALGLSRVRVLTALFGTAIGFAPLVGVMTYFGAEILDWFAAQSIGMWIGFVAAIITFIAIRRYRRRPARAVGVYTREGSIR